MKREYLDQLIDEVWCEDHGMHLMGYLEYPAIDVRYALEDLVVKSYDLGRKSTKSSLDELMGE
jgi:hypothetical protein